MTQEFMHFFDECNPAFDAGEAVEITVNQTLEGLSTDNKINISPGKIKLTIQGIDDQDRLGVNEIVGMYPAPGSDNSLVNFLPHIALRSRTLPWERRVYPDQKPQYPWDKVWLALLLLTQKEVDQNKINIDEITSNKTIKLLPETLNNILPHGKELGLLCHMRQIPESQKEAKLDDDGSISIVICNRLPEANTLNHVFLVSLKGCSDLYAPDGNIQTRLPQSKSLPVLHYWSFEASAEGDFESVIKKIRFNGKGVLRYGTLPPPKTALSGNPPVESLLDKNGYFKESLKASDGIKQSDARYHGPLLPFANTDNEPEHLLQPYAIARAPEEFSQAGQQDYTYASAFELGRVMALSEPDMIENLQHLKAVAHIRYCEGSHEVMPDFKSELEDFIKGLRPDRGGDSEDWGPGKPNPLDQLDIVAGFKTIPTVSVNGIDKIISKDYPNEGIMDKIKRLKPSAPMPVGLSTSEISLNSIDELQLDAKFSELKTRVR